MSTFAVVVIIVGAVGILLACTRFFRSKRAADQLGATGGNWFENPDERLLQDRPSEDTRDEPLPQRPVRGRG
jgi:hypothetical protein